MGKHFEPAKPGTTLAGYSVLAEVGRGAASIIYLVQDPKSKQVWALKHIEKHEAKDQRFLDQALREYEIAQKVKSPVIRHIEKVIKSRVRLVTVKELFLLMEYVDGVSVERNPPSSLDDALWIFDQTAEGLAGMHECGYVHADMKPNNIVVNERGDVKIIDLGQACPIGTVKERIQGTPEYIAPEQAHRRAITPLTDVYNLGGTMYWVLTGRHIPTALAGAKRDSLLDGLDEAMIELPTPPKELNSAVPEALNDLIMRCVQPAMEHRPDSMADVLDEIRSARAALNPDKAAG